MVGIPNGRFSSVPGLGIQILRTGGGFCSRSRFSATVKRSSGSRKTIPSTPGVFLPWLSCVTRRTASNFADRDLNNRRCKLRTFPPVASLFSPIDASLERVDTSLDLGPRNVRPCCDFGNKHACPLSLPQRLPGTLPDASIPQETVPTSAVVLGIPGLSPRRSLLGQSFPAGSCARRDSLGRREPAGLLRSVCSFDEESGSPLVHRP